MKKYHLESTVNTITFLHSYVQFYIVKQYIKSPTQTRHFPHYTRVLRVTFNTYYTTYQRGTYYTVSVMLLRLVNSYWKLGKHITDLPNKHQSPALLLCTLWLRRYHKHKPPWSSSTPTPQLYFPAPPLTLSSVPCVSRLTLLPYNTCLTRFCCVVCLVAKCCVSNATHDLYNE